MAIVEECTVFDCQHRSKDFKCLKDKVTISSFENSEGDMEITCDEWEDILFKGLSSK